MKVKRFQEFLNEAKKTSKGVLKIIFTGDIMQHQKQIEDSKDKKYDYEKVFKDVKFLFESADIVIGNLETTFSGDFGNKQKNGEVYFSAPDEFAKGLKEAGFTHICIANNHILDHGVPGYQRTIEILEKNDLIVIEGSKIIETEDYKFEVYNFTTHINQEGPKDLVDNFKKAYKTAEYGLDFNIAFPHWGGQYTQQETKDQIEMAQELCNMGYEYVIGSGPHVNNQTVLKDDKIIAYSLGDFLSDHLDNAAKNEGKILSLKLEDNKIVDLREYNTKSQTEDGETIIRLLNINELI
jgi:poly-gamma-glutamate capsule biosynthesis protein CapA/YwtB (metallophosphatase superfamily)